jgi:hypothetical protein
MKKRLSLLALLLGFSLLATATVLAAWDRESSCYGHVIVQSFQFHAEMEEERWEKIREIIDTIAWQADVLECLDFDGTGWAALPHGCTNVFGHSWG